MITKVFRLKPGEGMPARVKIWFQLGIALICGRSSLLGCQRWAWLYGGSHRALPDGHWHNSISRSPSSSLPGQPMQSI